MRPCCLAWPACGAGPISVSSNRALPESRWISPNFKRVPRARSMPPSEHTAPHLDNREPHIGHETRDVNIPAIVLLAAAVAATVLVVLVLLWYLMRAMEFAAIHDEPALSPLADTQQTPPAPRLQDAPV